MRDKTSNSLYIYACTSASVRVCVHFALHTYEDGLHDVFFALCLIYVDNSWANIVYHALSTIQLGRGPTTCDGELPYESPIVQPSKLFPFNALWLPCADNILECIVLVYMMRSTFMDLTKRILAWSLNGKIELLQIMITFPESSAFNIQILDIYIYMWIYYNNVDHSVLLVITITIDKNKY